MSEGEPRVTLVVSLEPDAASDTDRVDALARRLRQQLLEFDVDSVELAKSGELPPGAKSGEVIALGTVLLTLAPAVLPKVIDFLQAWMLRGAGRTVKIRAASGGATIDVEYSPGVTSEEEITVILQSLSRTLAKSAEGA